jgi:hypothetical protein
VLGIPLAFVGRRRRPVFLEWEGCLRPSRLHLLVPKADIGDMREFIKGFNGVLGIGRGRRSRAIYSFPFLVYCREGTFRLERQIPYMPALCVYLKHIKYINSMIFSLAKAPST